MVYWSVVPTSSDTIYSVWLYTQPAKISPSAETPRAELLRNPARGTIAAPSEARPMPNKTLRSMIWWVVVGRR